LGVGIAARSSQIGDKIGNYRCKSVSPRHTPLLWGKERKKKSVKSFFHPGGAKKKILRVGLKRIGGFLNRRNSFSIYRERVGKGFGNNPLKMSLFVKRGGGNFITRNFGKWVGRETGLKVIKKGGSKK